jgi:gamma-glutamylcyclotransferase (GGCT)/AIG2-like uncharacterized protein YtfP
MHRHCPERIPAIPTIGFSVSYTRWRDPKLVLPRLDEYEECSDNFPLPHEYSRKPLSIELVGGGSVVARVYLYNHDVSKLQKIISGNYLTG